MGAQGVLGPNDLPGLLVSSDLVDGGRAILSDRDWPAKRRDILARFLPLLGTVPSRVPSPDTEVLATEDCGDHRRSKIRYRVEEDEWCAAWLLTPLPDRDQRPAVVCCHQTIEQGKDEPVGLAGRPSLHYALELVRQGYVCLAPDCITAGERIYPGHRPYETDGFYERHPDWSALGKMLWDHQRALDVLGSLDEVDADRLGVIGHSLGGENAFMLGACDHRIRAIAASCAYLPFAVDPEPTRWCRDSWFVYLPALRRTIRALQHPSFTWLEVLALLAPRAFHYTYALEDAIFPGSVAIRDDMRQLERLYDILGSRLRFGAYDHPGEHDYPKAARQAAYRMMAAVLRP